MTALRPEHDSSGAPYDANGAHGGGFAHGDAGALEEAVDHLADPLTDPLPGQHPSPWFRSASVEPRQQSPDQQRSPVQRQPRPQQQPQSPVQQQPEPQPQSTPKPTYEQLYGAYAPEPIADDETVGLRTADTRRAAEPGAGLKAGPADGLGEGRAARRKAAKKGGARPSPPRPAGAPLSRLEARRAERARRPSPGAVISRGLGEVFITVGVLMLLFVTYQLWWTNIRAQQQADGAAHDLQEDWASGKGKPGTFEPGQGFALLHIPKLDVVVPVAEGIDKQKVLDRGMVGHYNEGATKTAMPDARTGNFAVAGHRNTHGEPFRYINRLEPGDPIVVETQDKYFVYKMANILPQTDPGNTSVIGPVPPGSGFTKPGRYITLTTCTPEFTSKYRMIVWGKMAEERPRSKGKPSALVN
ncbi:class E sortase [Streptomyces alboniger]|uniref:Class E sortase n=1 Tax=Streptomyces alboniger TaxID=132473 RepID=A0A5J6HKX8_STRAD|nr:class E sortase [Streptomyces alboniger]QEV19113.1 class E sortase [Streptomyces alboniger]